LKEFDNYIIFLETIVVAFLEHSSPVQNRTPKDIVVNLAHLGDISHKTCFEIGCNVLP